MRNLAFVPLALLCMGAAAPQPSRSAPPAAGADAPKSPRAQARPGEILLTSPAHCLDTEPRRTDGQTLGPQRLDRLPPGDLTLTVMRQVNGCPEPVRVREGIGGPAFRAEPGR